MKDGNVKNNLIIYQAENGAIEFRSDVDAETIWATQQQIADVFDVTIPTINEHIKNIYRTEELQEDSTIRKFRIVRNESNREVEREINHYNLDMIISIGYRVNSKRGTQFRELLKELRESVKITGNVLKYKELSNDESAGLLEIISDYAYALDNNREN